MTLATTKSKQIIKQITIKLPWPPSANTYWRRNGGRYFISKAGMDFRASVLSCCWDYKGSYPKDIKLQVLIEAYPPDKRRRDLDNILKGLLDALQFATVYQDDSQIDKLTVWRCLPLDGSIVVTIAPIE